jgi:hypothetical protein
MPEERCAAASGRCCGSSKGWPRPGVESTLLARQDAPLYTAARKQGWRVEPLGITRALGCLRGHTLIHAHDARSHSLGAFLRGTAAGGVAARGIPGGLALEVRQGAALPGGLRSSSRTC